ncbi:MULTISPECIES: hypothetical protein [unclassified Streptomyces]|uniref:hypothetical protein n=1 Tax=unclassified Streptomyces TaxID=2593676 RepID=UPI000884860F|nr:MULTISPECIES: hypothetical protein [unclassified Streptomyces]PBC83549.1 hypothetical protein BX261_3498 [Streptomyces sp. 2321.6]SDR41267.1 hypothetical protein SAMN05216511_3704 [Streptomyces sp. KS_16]SED00269.1 hypothetical protein SAMN05428940_3499 [Streptomyces sp. 2133.1]SNC69627.1 hypothetical protein SAMN06272741_3491 [Streptomyces sp. 2114.4]
MSANAPLRPGGRVPERERSPWRRGRAVAGRVLLLCGALLLPLGLAATWARAELTETDSYVAAVAPLAQNPAVQNAVVDDVTDGVMAHVRLDGLLDAVPRAERPALRKHFTRGLRQFVATQVRQVVTGRGFPAVWNGVHRTAHRSLDGSLTASGRSAVTLDLTPVVERVKRQLSHNGMGLDLLRRVPRAGVEIVLLKAPDVPRIRAVYRVVRTGALLLPPAAALCLTGGLLLARQRRRALICTGLGCAAAAALLAAALALVRGRALEALPAVISRPAAGAYADALTGPLLTGVWLIVGAGTLTAALAAAGPPAARTLRARRLARAAAGP